MNFEFSEELQQVKSEARSFLREHARGSARGALESGSGFDRELWGKIAALGWVGAAVPEEYGGIGLGAEGLCVLADEIGASAAAIPFASTAYLGAPAILAYGSEAQKQAHLPRIAAGEEILAWALAEGNGAPREAALRAEIRGGKLYGTKIPVIDANVAHYAVVAAREAGELGLYLVALDQPAVTRELLESLDPARDTGRIVFDGASAERLPGAQGFSAITAVLDRAAVPMAFEQIGGAQAALEMARDYAMQRMAFGRPIASFQAIKHKLADVYVAIELARSNAYFGAWALGADAPELTEAASAARVAAITAYEMASAENIQTHGGMGFTWEFDCHLYYRRAKHLSLAIGAAPYWKDRLIAAVETRNAA